MTAANHGAPGDGGPTNQVLATHSSIKPLLAKKTVQSGHKVGENLL